MIKSVRFGYILICILILGTILPDLYWKVFEKNIRAPFVLYSPVKKDFLFNRYENKTVKRVDSKGNSLTQKEMHKLAPIFFFRQLSVDGTLPDTLWGKALEPNLLKRHNQFIKISPRQISTPQMQLFPLFESASGNINLSMPEDFFRINERVEFINCEKNIIDEPKSELFTKVLSEAGFNFPAEKMFGNPSARKPFDEGYFITDSKGKFFHLKMIKGKPFVRKIEIPSDVKIAYMEVYEHSIREFYGVVVSESSKLYLLKYKNYELQKIPVENYNYLKDNLQFRRNLLYRTFVITKENQIDLVVTDTNYEIVDSYREQWEDKFETAAGKIYSALFPFDITIFSGLSNYLQFNFVPSTGYLFIILHLILVVCYYIFRARKKNNSDKLLECGIILFTGIYGFTALIVLKTETE